MKRSLLFAVLVALAAPNPGRADTVYFKHPDTNRIQSISGTIVEETGSHVKILADDGREVSILADNVFQVVREEAGQTNHGLAPDESTGGLNSVDLSDVGSRTKPYRLGVKGGMNISNLSVDPAALEEQDSLKSFAVGGWCGVPINSRFSIQAEALYSVKGDSENAGAYTVSTTMSYIDLPVLAKVGLMPQARVKPSLFLGPAVAFNLTANSKLEGGDDPIELDVKDQVNAVDFGVVVGGGVDFQVSKHTIGVDVRYSRGLTNAVTEDANGEAQNQVIAVLGSVSL